MNWSIDMRRLALFQYREDIADCASELQCDICRASTGAVVVIDGWFLSPRICADCLTKALALLAPPPVKGKPGLVVIDECEPLYEPDKEA
jgi:hypothetical protein